MEDFIDSPAYLVVVLMILFAVGISEHRTQKQIDKVAATAVQDTVWVMVEAPERLVIEAVPDSLAVAPVDSLGVE